jgi:serine/threonine-protein kinase
MAAEPARFAGSIHHAPSVIHPYRPPTAPAPHAPSATSRPHTHHAAPEHPAHPSSHPAGVPAAAITHADIENVSRHLAHFIGPIAEIVVKRAAKRSLTREDLLSLVAEEIESPTDRAKFLRECHH